MHIPGPAMSKTMCAQGINAILFYIPVIFSSLGTGQSTSLIAAVAVRFVSPYLEKSEVENSKPACMSAQFTSRVGE